MGCRYVIWDVLGIDPTNDISEIKKAYAKLAKQYNPEENPDEFARIHDAFKQAMKAAKGQKNNNILSVQTVDISTPKKIFKDRNLSDDEKKEAGPEDVLYNFSDIFNEKIIIKEKTDESLIDDFIFSEVSTKKENAYSIDYILKEIKKIIEDKDICDSIYVWKRLTADNEVRKILLDPDNFDSIDSVLKRARFNKAVAYELKALFGNKTKIVNNYEYGICYVDITGKRKLEYYTSGTRKYKIKVVLRIIFLFLVTLAIILMFAAACFY